MEMEMGEVKRRGREEERKKKRRDEKINKDEMSRFSRNRK
jgi:hypothetical protein